MNYLLYSQKYPLVLNRFFKWVSDRNNYVFPEDGFDMLIKLYNEFLLEFEIFFTEGPNGFPLDFELSIKSEPINDFIKQNNLFDWGEYTSCIEPYEYVFQVLQDYMNMNENKY